MTAPTNPTRPVCRAGPPRIVISSSSSSLSAQKARPLPPTGASRENTKAHKLAARDSSPSGRRNGEPKLDMLVMEENTPRCSDIGDCNSTPPAIGIRNETTTHDAIESSSSGDSIQVAVRIRPFLPFEAGHAAVLQLSSGSGTCKSIQLVPSMEDEYYHSFSNSSTKRTYTFDAAFGAASTQNMVYQDCVAPLVKACLDGYNATVLACKCAFISAKTYAIQSFAYDIDSRRSRVS